MVRGCRAGQHLDGHRHRLKAGRDADTRGQAFTASLESGYPLALSERWTLEPQAQLIYQHTRVDGFSDAVSEVRIRDDNALTARLGARLQGEYAAAAQVWRPTRR